MEPLARGVPPEDLNYRHPLEDDHARVLEVLDGWWGGLGGADGSRQRANLLPRLFFQHFTDTSFVVERDGRLQAFLVGFLSQSRPSEAYIHFVGVAPELHGLGIGRDLYERFFALVRGYGRTEVRAITSVANTGSQAFHARMGFTSQRSGCSPSDSTAHPDYDGKGMDRVTFHRFLDV
jgi:GNAT superfamily N-acetyltransferase